MQYENFAPRKPLWVLILLGFGMYVAPYVFAWFTLKPGYPRWYMIVSFVYTVILVVSVAIFVSFGGDRWPTTIDNRSQSNIVFRYKHIDYADWSAPSGLEGGRAMPLSLFHFLKDIQALSISERGKTYTLSGNALRRFQAICAGKSDCFLVYKGNGNLVANKKPTQGMIYLSEESDK
jgi:hypothetical protein